MSNAKAEENDDSPLETEAVADNHDMTKEGDVVEMEQFPSYTLCGKRRAIMRKLVEKIALLLSSHDMKFINVSDEHKLVV